MGQGIINSKNATRIKGVKYAGTLADGQVWVFDSASGNMIPGTPGGGGSNIYTADGTLTGNRIMNMGGNTSVIEEELPDDDEPVDEEPVDEEPVEEEPDEDTTSPTDVFGVRAESSNEKVTLSWQPASDDGKVEHYRVYYSLDPSNLNTVIDTWDNTPTWYIPGLKNGTQYFFAIAAVDENDNESNNKSSLISSVPFDGAAAVKYIPPAQLVVPPKQLPAKSVAPKTSSTGPEVMWFLLGSVILGQLYFKFRNKLC